MMDERYPFDQAAGILKVIAHPVRLNILVLLEREAMKVGDIRSAVGAKQSVTSQHLNAMASLEVLGKERRGNQVFYHIKKKEVLKLLSCIKSCCKGEETKDHVQKNN